MRRELSSESNLADLVDYLLEKDVDIHILVPDDRVPSLQIRVDCADTCGRLIRHVESIDMVKYMSAKPEMQNMIVARTIHGLIEELVKRK